MRTLGWTTTAVLGAGALVGLAVGVRSIPDIRRYFRIRSM